MCQQEKAMVVFGSIFLTTSIEAALLSFCSVLKEMLLVLRKY